MDATIPGTYGTIRETLRHLVRAEEGYLRLLTGERLSEPMSDGPLPLAELAERIHRLAPRWELLAQDSDVPRRKVTTSDGWRVQGTVASGTADPPRRRPPQPGAVDPRRTRHRASRPGRVGYAEANGLMQPVASGT